MVWVLGGPMVIAAIFPSPYPEMPKHLFACNTVVSLGSCCDELYFMLGLYSIL